MSDNPCQTQYDEGYQDGYDAGKAELEAEVERLREEVTRLDAGLREIQRVPWTSDKEKQSAVYCSHIAVRVLQEDPSPIKRPWERNWKAFKDSGDTAGVSDE